MRHLEALSFTFDCADFAHLGDSSEFPSRSPLLLFENDHLLGPRHAIHADIAQVGGGRYSHWEGSVFFSTSDNSDPRSNSKQYSVALADYVGLDDSTLAVAVESLAEAEKASRHQPVVDYFLRATCDTAFYYHDPLFDSKERALCELLRQQSSMCGGSVGAVRAYNLLRWWTSQLGRPISGQAIAEIGPGRNAALGLLLLMGGARSYVGLDAYPSMEWWHPTVLKSVWQIAREFYPWMDTPRGTEIMRSDDAVRNTPDFPLQFARAGEKGYPLPDESVDIIFSVSVLEHVEKPTEAFAEMYRILRPGGLMVHSVDLASHEPFNATADVFNPFSFLNYTDEEWRAKWTPDVMKYYQNRWRKADFLNVVNDRGFRNVQCLSDQNIPPSYFNEGLYQSKRNAFKGITPEMRAAFAPRFKAMSDEDLGLMTLFLSAVK